MRALLDANVFFSIWTLDPILSFADEEYFEPLWSERIMDEVRGHLPEVWDHATPQAVDHYVRVLDSAFPDASVAGWRPLERTIQLDDEDDRHVVAAALLSARATEDDATAAPFPYTFLNTTTATRAAHRHQP